MKIKKFKIFSNKSNLSMEIENKIREKLESANFIENEKVLILQ